MRLCGMCAIFGMACSAPANEALPAGPPRSRPVCEKSGDVEKQQDDVERANPQKIASALATYLASRGLTADAAQPEERWGTLDTKGDRAIVTSSQPLYFVFEHDGGVVLVDGSSTDDHCRMREGAEYYLAKNDAGTEVLIRIALVRKPVSHVEQCGTCEDACGLPGESVSAPLWTLPIAADAPLLVEETSVDLDAVAVTCEHEQMAQ